MGAGWSGVITERSVRREGCRQLAVVGLWAILTATFSSALIEKFLGAFKQR